MGNDLDTLDEIFADEATKKARAVGKFQPKAKFRPQKKSSVTTSVPPSKAVQAINSAPSELSKPIETSKPSEQCSNVVSNDNGDCLPQTNADEEAVALNVSNPENVGGGNEVPVLSSVEDPTYTCEVPDVLMAPGVSTDVASEPIVSSADVQDDMHDKDMGREEMYGLDSLNMTELTAKSGHRTGKFQTKKKLHMQIQVSESVSDSLCLQSVSPDIEYAEKEVPTSQQDVFLDLSSLGFTPTMPTDGTSELPLNEESLNLMEVAKLDSCLHLEDMPEVSAKLASRRAKTGDSETLSPLDLTPLQQKDPILIPENETGRVLRPRKGKTNFFELVDEDGDEVLATAEISQECLPVEEDNGHIEESQVESESQKKNVKRKSKKTDDGKEKPAKKSKKTKEDSNQEGAKRKKFSHSTRRRRVDKTLLETPEDEIDYQQVALRDLIQLAEHRERETKRGAAAVAPAPKQSMDNSSGFYNDENFTSEQGEENNDGDDPPMVDTTEYFNYHSHREKTTKSRWSKQETEQFYEAVRQFGTDFSLIEMLFPDRSRREVKLKYKKEERQHPMRLREALTNRSGDLSLFQTVREHLKRKAEEEKLNGDDDDVVEVTENEAADEGTLEADDDEAKAEKIEEEVHETVVNDSTEVQSPLKSDDEGDEEDDFLRWSQYRSDI